MKKRERIITIAVTAAAVLLVVGITALAAGAFGSRDDPLVTLSYITGKVEPEVKDYAEEKAAASEKELEKTFDQKLSDYSASINDKLSEGTVYDEGSVFAALKLEDGKTVRCGTGTEIMVRSGTVKTGSGFKASDTTSGTESGSTLTVNHMYVVTEDGQITASGSVTLLIRGDYTA
ncbi:MAG: hypothetical protein IJL71_01230 [Oscillospiraceae bacterium]|nr:hypothetical protein [Oscillospiraceae bacterium]